VDSITTVTHYQGEESSGIGRWFLISCLLHFALLLSYYPASMLSFLSGGKRDLNVKLAKVAVRVDIVAMPKMTIKELRALPKIDQGSVTKVAPPAPLPVSTIKDDSNEEQYIKKVKKKSLFDRLKSLSATRINEKVAKTKKRRKKRSRVGDTSGGISAKEQQEMRKLLVAGNRLSKGRALVGSNSQESAGEFSAYLDDLPDHVRPYWKLPSYLMGRGFRCRIRIFLAEGGGLIKSVLFQSSGNSEFDQKALRAVKMSAPFPSLSRSLIARGVRGDIVLGFPL
jgi:colicin import membrane protein